MRNLRHACSLALPCIVFAVPAHASGMDEARQIVARTVQARCELIDMQYLVRGLAVGTFEREAAAARLHERALAVEKALRPDVMRLQALQPRLSPQELNELAKQSSGATDQCATSAMLAYRARVEEGTAAAPEAAPAGFVRHGPRRDKLDPQQSAPAGLEAQAPQR